MTTQDFISKTYDTTATRERHCSSVFTDYNGTVYSYGYHYPLAFNVNGLDFVNTAGYSSTTAKHIAWAKHSLGYDNYIGVKLNRAEAPVIASSLSTQDEKIAAIKTALEREILQLKERADSKKRKNTAVYYSIERELHQARVNYMRVIA